MNSWRDTISCLLLCAALYLTGCVSHAPQPLPTDQQGMANDILFAALGQVGIPYRYGGNTPEGGFDCSGLIQYVYALSASIEMPRTVAEMDRLAAPVVDKANLQAGDLVIFATGARGRPSHAGIYVGEGRFVHAPSRGGVVRMDFLGEPYWQRSYLHAKRPLAALSR